MDGTLTAKIETLAFIACHEIHTELIVEASG